jgi:hypothetical protein
MSKWKNENRSVDETLKPNDEHQSNGWKMVKKIMLFTYQSASSKWNGESKWLFTRFFIYFFFFTSINTPFITKNPSRLLCGIEGFPFLCFAPNSVFRVFYIYIYILYTHNLKTS